MFSFGSIFRSHFIAEKQIRNDEFCLVLFISRLNIRNIVIIWRTNFILKTSFSRRVQVNCSQSFLFNYFKDLNIFFCSYIIWSLGNHLILTWAADWNAVPTEQTKLWRIWNVFQKTFAKTKLRGILLGFY